MDRSRVIYLIAKAYEQNTAGEWVKQETRKKVYCNVRSATASEWFNGGRQGLNPDYTVTMFRPDYSGETTLELDGVRYQVYRTYETRNDLIELHVQREAGT